MSRLHGQERATNEPTGKRCTKCGEPKPLEGFGRDRAKTDGLTCWCKDCQREAKRRWREANPEAAREEGRRKREAHPGSSRRWRAANPEAARELSRRQAQRIREAVFDRYGRACACCGATERLTIDHVNGDGAEHCKQIRGGRPRLHRWLVANGFPAEPPLQVLCNSCNRSKGTGDRCRIDHQTAEAA